MKFNVKIGGERFNEDRVNKKQQHHQRNNFDGAESIFKRKDVQTNLLVNLSDDHRNFDTLKAASYNHVDGRKMNPRLDLSKNLKKLNSNSELVGKIGGFMDGMRSGTFNEKVASERNAIGVDQVSQGREGMLSDENFNRSAFMESQVSPRAGPVRVGSPGPTGRNQQNANDRNFVHKG
jgi:hypothetical protein